MTDPTDDRPTIETWEVREDPDLYVMSERGYPVCLVGGYANATKYHVLHRQRAARIAALPAMEAACRAIDDLDLCEGYSLADGELPKLWRALSLAREALKMASGKVAR